MHLLTPNAHALPKTPVGRFAAQARLVLLLGAMAQLPGAVALAQSADPQAGISAVGLPGLGDGAGMSIADERRMGDDIAQRIYKDPDLLDDPLLVDYLYSIWNPLLKSAELSGQVAPELRERFAWELLIDRSKQVNAFALPGGYLGVNLGLLAITERPEELASVLAHELSHVSQRHIARMVARQGSDTPWLIGAMILAALAARDNADVANAAIAGSQALALQNQLNFSRDMEREADRVGFGILTEAGLPGQGFVDMFSKLQQASRLNDDGSFPYLRSHPLTTERMADMHLRLNGSSGSHAQGGDGPAVSSGGAASPLSLHALMAARARVLSETVPDRWQDWYKAGTRAEAPWSARYEAALAAQRLGLHAEAIRLAETLRAQAARQANTATGTANALDHLLLEALLKSPEGAKDARTGILRDQALAGASRAAVLQGALAALATGQPAVASSRLLAWVVDHPRDALAWQTLSRLQTAMGQRVRALRSEAEAHVAILDNPAALERLKAAQALPLAVRRADAFEMAIVDARKIALEQLVRDAARKQ